MPLAIDDPIIDSMLGVVRVLLREATLVFAAQTRLGPADFFMLVLSQVAATLREVDREGTNTLLRDLLAGGELSEAGSVAVDRIKTAWLKRERDLRLTLAAEQEAGR